MRLREAKRGVCHVLTPRAPFEPDASGRPPSRNLADGAAASAAISRVIAWRLAQARPRPTGFAGEFADSVTPALESFASGNGRLGP